MIIGEPRKIKLELMSYDIELIIEELVRVPHEMYEYLNHGKLVEKLKLSLKQGLTKGAKE